MKISQMFPSQYASAADLGGKEVALEIAGIKTETVHREKGEENVFVLYFKGATKGIILSRRLAMEISAAVGSDDTDHWAGKRIAIYPTQTRAFGKVFDVFGARPAPAIAPVPLKPAANAQTIPATEPPHPAETDPDQADPDLPGDFSGDEDELPY